MTITNHDRNFKLFEDNCDIILLNLQIKEKHKIIWTGEINNETEPLR